MGHETVKKSIRLDLPGHIATENVRTRAINLKLVDLKEDLNLTFG